MIPSDAWPNGDRLSWSDDEARLHYDFTEEPWATTPYSAAENVAADDRAAEQARAEAAVDLRSQVATLLDQQPSTDRTAALVEALARLALEVP